MVGVKLQGGLGNQMFQYAAARGISKNNNKIFIDSNFFLQNQNSSERFTARKYELNIFGDIKARLAGSFLHNLFCNGSLQYRIARKVLLPGFHYIQQIGYNYVEGLSKVGSNLYLDGYFQSEKYFSGLRGELIREFSFPALDDLNAQQVKLIQAQPNAVSIHVRRGDYLKPEILLHHGILPLSYYRKAIEILASKYNDLHFFIFSDDLEWCRNNFSLPGGNFSLMQVDNTKEAWKDMCLMTFCKHHIVANSSFSWWGAWLSQQQGVNLAPSRWFNPDVVNFDIDDFIPSSWQIVHYD